MTLRRNLLSSDRPWKYAHIYVHKLDMPYVSALRPLHKLAPHHRLRTQPNTHLHLVCCESLTPSSRCALRKVDERAFIGP